MRRARVAIASLLAATACVSEPGFAPRSNSFRVEGSPASESGWIHLRVEGREDTCLDLPSGSLKEWRYGSLDGFFGTRRRRSISYSLRPLKLLDGPIAAVSVSFIWLDASFGPFSPSEIAQLEKTLTSAAQTQALVKRRIFEARADLPADWAYETEDLGGTEISGHPARRVEWWDVRVRSTPSSHEFYLVSISAAEALIIDLGFDPRATHEDRNVVLPKVIRSIAIQGATRARARP
jgi:hypothetical protein